METLHLGRRVIKCDRSHKAKRLNAEWKQFPAACMNQLNVTNTDHEDGDVGEEARSDDQQHHRPGEPEAQVFKGEPARRRKREIQRDKVRLMLKCLAG